MSDTCTVCAAVEDDPMLLEICSGCGQFFHLNPFQNRPGQDCGNVWAGGGVNPALQFGCNHCLQAAGFAIGGEPAAGAATRDQQAAARELARMQEAMLTVLSQQVGDDAGA